MSRPIVLVLALSAVVLAACAEPTTTEVFPGMPAFAKPSGGGGTQGTDTDSRAILVWADFLPGTSAGTGVQGDDLDVDGGTTGTLDAYRGERCGVHAKIFWYDKDYSQSGDLVFDPDFNGSGDCPVRTLRFDLDQNASTVTWTRLAPFSNVRQIMQVETSREQVFIFSSVNLADCDRIRFGDPDPADKSGTRIAPGTTGGILVTRTGGAAGSTDPGSWTVQTRDGIGKCLVYSKGKYIESGITHTLPFHLSVTEVQYPY